MKNSDPLGNNPLAQGIFSKTTSYPETPVIAGPEALGSSSEVIAEEQKTGTINHKLETINQEVVPRNHKPEAGFLSDNLKEKITIQISEPVNEWVDGLVRGSKKRNGQKIQKQIWVQAALELMQSAPIDWGAVGSVEELKAELDQVARKLGKRMKGRDHDIGKY